MFDRMPADLAPAYMDKPTQIFVPFGKVDKTQRMVFGFASTEALDAEGESIDRAAIVDALPDYMKFANIREMHQASAVGKAKEASMLTKGGKDGLYIGARIVDDEAWQKVLEGVYQGFSVGGKKLEKRGNVVTKIHLSEISIVDRPANPDCTFDQVAKRHPLVDREPGVVERLAKAEQKDFKVQTLVMSKDRFKTADDAKAWAKKNGFAFGSVDDAENTFRLRQFDPSECKPNSHRTFELTDGVQATGCTAPGVKEADMPDSQDARVGKLLLKAVEPYGGLKALMADPKRKDSLMNAANALGHLDVIERLAKGESVDEKDRDGAFAYVAGMIGKDVDRALAGSKPPSPDPKTKPVPGGSPARKEAADMPDTTTKEDAMKAHKARHDAIGKELAEMAEAHKGDADMSEAIKAAQAQHAALAERFKKHDEPDGDEAPADGPKAKLNDIHRALKEMSDSVDLAGTKVHKNAAGDPSSNADWKNAAAMIGDLAKSVQALAGTVTDLKKRTPEPPKTFRAIHKREDLPAEVLAKADLAVAEAEKGKDAVGLIKLAQTGALGVQIN